MTTQYIVHEDKGWIGFDLDGTLILHSNNGDVLAHKLGEPIAEIVQLIHKHKAEGYEIKIFTARVSIGDIRNCSPDTIRKRALFKENARASIQAWCREYFGEEFDITCEKDFNCVRIYDDRARHVICNTGRVCCDA